MKNDDPRMWEKFIEVAEGQRDKTMCPDCKGKLAWAPIDAEKCLCGCEGWKGKLSGMCWNCNHKLTFNMHMLGTEASIEYAAKHAEQKAQVKKIISEAVNEIVEEIKQRQQAIERHRNN